MGRVSTSLGYAIGCEEAGGGDATPIVFLHGVGSDKSVWRPQLDHFGQERRAIAFDYPGYGDSDFSERATTRSEFAEAIWAALTSLKVGAAHICGLSLGGIIAMEMFGLAGDRCRSLILADTFATHPNGQGIYERSMAAATDAEGLARFAHARAPALVADQSRHLLPEIIATMSRLDPRAYRIGAAAVWLAEERVRASEIEVSTLVLCGKEDGITPPALSEELAALIAGSRLALIEGAGHLSNLEQPEAFNNVVEEFIASVEAGA
jgi:3-oxoadipate enol-lactonase